MNAVGTSLDVVVGLVPMYRIKTTWLCGLQPFQEGSCCWLPVRNNRDNRHSHKVSQAAAEARCGCSQCWIRKAVQREWQNLVALLGFNRTSTQSLVEITAWKPADQRCALLASSWHFFSPVTLPSRHSTSCTLRPSEFLRGSSLFCVKLILTLM